MSQIALVISDVDGTLVTPDKQLTDAALAAVARLRAAGIGFTITSSRPAIGMQWLIEPLGITLPVGPFNGSSILDPSLEVLDQSLIPAPAVQITLTLLEQFGVDIWLFTNDNWFIRRDDGKYVPHERDTIHFDPTQVEDFAPLADSACKIVGASADAALLERCEQALQAELGDQAFAIRSQSYYLDVTPPGRNKGTFVQAMAKRLDISTDAIATIGDMQNDLAMFRVSGLSVAMGNATDDVKRCASHVTGSNEDDGFAGAVDYILARNGEG
ncbi:MULTISPECIES: Cof-type HAD-IIB family hydrolase [Rhodopseudomonas]|uniref:Hydrolase n=1 Tax=Rhodopseudomonas palustris TaxID=1076 RepID=A0A0D7F3R8_RHOPL|nr:MULTISPECIES: Cof-type HAD-IIB family hydrolase [Rhodopseudomonas]KIZ46407.1 hydrolase [Rhodopseudomonas palustris]MDF3809671.1 Cof-type HAD-IIB family hydrolase [Rhodopseudomonas sp. BAL398]WOK18221.1 Cof-type HAD-IIB family hydrolase [Rhodopseudomonas sp. BAL398]